MHILLNLEGPSASQVDIGEVLENFKAFTKDLPSDMRGLCLSNSLEIREVHNEFGNLADFLAFSDDNNEHEFGGARDPFHYVALIPNNGSLLELDGLKDAPVVHPLLDTWHNSALELIKKKISEELGGSEDIRYNLMALVSDRRKFLQDEINELESKNSKSSSEYSSSEADSSTHTARLMSLKDDLAVEESKWSRFRKEWEDRKPKLTEAPKVELSSQVENLLKSMESKGLFQKNKN